MDNLVYGRLTEVPAAKRSYQVYLRQASSNQLKEAIEIMKNRNGHDKGRIAACRKELKRRDKYGEDDNEINE